MKRHRKECRRVDAVSGGLSDDDDSLNNGTRHRSCLALGLYQVSLKLIRGEGA